MMRSIACGGEHSCWVLMGVTVQAPEQFVGFDLALHFGGPQKRRANGGGPVKMPQLAP